MVGEQDGQPEALWEIFIPIHPVRWSVKAGKAGAHATLYSPSKLKDYQAKVISFLKSAFRLQTIEGPICLEVEFLLDRPKSATRAFPEVKPDLTNLLKAIEDCLTKAGVIADDKYVIACSAAKFYGQGLSGTNVRILSLDK